MAENTGTYNANAVYGSLAYDFNNPALYPDYAEEASWQVSHQVQDIPAEEELPQVETAAKNKQAISPLAVIGAAFASVLIVVMLLAQVSLTAVSNEAVELTERIETLEMERNRLRIEFEGTFNLTEIEKYAIEELGMQKPTKDQIFCINTAARDKVEIIPAEQPDGLLSRASDFAGSIGEYLG